MNAELQRHIKARRGVGRIDLDARNIVNTPVASADHAGDFIEAIFAAIEPLQRAAGSKTACDDGENDGSIDGLEFVVERAIHKDRAGRS